MNTTKLAEIAQIASFVLYAIITAWPMVKGGIPSLTMMSSLPLILLVIIAVSTGYLYYKGKYPSTDDGVRTDFSRNEIEADIRAKLDELHYSVRKEQPRQGELFRMSVTHEGIGMDVILQSSPAQTIAIIASMDMSNIKLFPLKQRQAFLLAIKAELIKFGVQMREEGNAENPGRIDIANVFLYSNKLNVVELAEKLWFVKRAVTLVQLQASLQSLSVPEPKT